MQPEKTPREGVTKFLKDVLPNWRPSRNQGLLTIRAVLVLAIVLSILSLIGRPFDVTVWDWLNLLIIPVLLAIGGYWFTSSQNRATQAAAESRAQDDALQSYLNQRGQLLLDKDSHLFHPEEGNDARTLARAWTLTLLPRLDGLRKRSVVQFLYESGLITKDHVVIDLTGANLAAVNLTSANLEGANLRGAYMARANLVDARLSEAELGNAKLFGADLSLAKLNGANLSEAILIGDSSRNTLGGTGLKNADLRYADLSETNLIGADVSTEQLVPVELLVGATMPDGQEYKAWLKTSEGKKYWDLRKPHGDLLMI